jgi:SNF2 family DNA or RNA helicase
MILLQAGFCEAQFFLWGEAGAEETPATARTRKTQAKAPALLPHAAGIKAILTALKETADLGELPRQGEDLVLWCPTVKNVPIASSPLIAPPPEEGAAVLRSWRVPALRLSPTAALNLLAHCVGRSLLQPGVLLGKSLGYWTTVLRFAGALVAREQLLPGVQPGPPSLRACWEPVPTGADAQRLKQLAQAMPGACRALATTAEAPPQVPAATVLDQGLRLLVDALVRSGTAAPSRPVKAGSRKQAPAFDSVHEHWLYALRAQEPTLEQAREQGRLAEQVSDWRRPIAVAASAPFRLCFRLEEPAAEEAAPRKRKDQPNGWYLRYLLQAVDDPSLLVPVADAWGGKKGKAGVLERPGFNRKEYLLQALGQAAQVEPAIERSLKEAAPAGYELDVSGAHAFLTEKAAALEQAGFGVFLPAWWTRKGTKQRLSARAAVRSTAMSAGSMLTLCTVVHFDWQVALGNEVLSLQELEALARLKAPLVRVRGQWVELSPEEIQAALDFWKEKGAGEASLQELVQMALGARTTTGGLRIDGVQADGWVGDFLSRLEGQKDFETIAPPAAFHGTLRPYQQRGYAWLDFLGRWGLGACLADDMGLGKTVQTLALLQYNREQGRSRPTLLVCPMSVVGNWQREAERFTPDLPVLVHHGHKRTRTAAFRKEAEKHALVLTSYSLLHRDFALFQEVPWDGVILDEAQNVKNPGTKQARAARSLPAGFRIALTGTPVENHVGDLWSIMEFLNPGFLGSQSDFRRSFLLPIQAHRDEEAGMRLKRLSGPFVLRRLKTDRSIIADLPEKMEMKVFCNLTREQATLYAAVVEETEAALKSADEGIRRKGVILATLSKLKQVCNHPAQFLGDHSAIPDRSGKLARLTEMLEEVVEVGDRALIFTQFTEMGDIIKRHLQEALGTEVLFLHGGTSKKERDRLVARFQGEEDGQDGAERPQLFLLSLKAGGTGLNLTAANHVFHFDRWWNPAVESQASDRAFRIGQTRQVQVHKYVCVGTVEEKIDEMIERKQEIAGKVVGTGEEWLTELSNEQLKGLFALRQEALAE